VAEKLNVVHLSTYDAEGGAARAATRLHLGLKNIGIKSTMIVGRKLTNFFEIQQLHRELRWFSRLFRSVKARLDAAPLFFNFQKMHTPWTIGWWSDRKIMRSLDAGSIVHLHWVGGGYLSLQNILAIKNPLVWTLHDAWPFTGGCHVVGECRKFFDNCGACEQLGSSFQKDLSWIGITRRKKLLSSGQKIFVAPSSWMQDLAKSSTILGNADVRVIPNGVDTKIFKPIKKSLAREKLQLSVEKKYILFSANNVLGDSNKGFERFRNIITLLKERFSSAEVEIIIIGKVRGKIQIDLPIHNFGYQSTQDNMALLYSAADVVCVPSTQESFGLVALEAMSCGTPVIAYRTSGLIDIVVDGETGFLAEPYSEQDFADQLFTLLSDTNLQGKMASASRQRALKKFDQLIVVNQYLEVYKELL
jgi:glycosyltransferase involved in cell wall biosynthesis